MKKVIIVSCFFRPNSISRGYLTYKYLSENFCVKVLYSHFSHVKKEYIKYDGEDFIEINATSYKKNISLKRIISHITYAINVKKYIESEKPDLVYIMIPPNIGAYYAIKGISNKETKVVVDIIDIWPEALPVPRIIKKIQDYTYGPVWKYFRKIAFKKSDIIISESKFFVDKLNLQTYKNKTRVIHLSKIPKLELQNNDFVKKEKNELTIGYLGSINNIYDFDSLVSISSKVVNKKVKVHIIGDGEKREWLLKQLSDRKIPFEYHGKIFDETSKFNILKNCDFGFNGYKDDTEVALSYKSIDYLSYGIPLLNSAKGDTWDLVDRFNIGINYTSHGINSLIDKLNKISNNDIVLMKKNSYQTFLNYFDWKVYAKNMEKVVRDLKLID